MIVFLQEFRGFKCLAWVVFNRVQNILLYINFHILTQRRRHGKNVRLDKNKLILANEPLANFRLYTYVDVNMYSFLTNHEI